jgi:hypothetical protein
MVSLSFSYGGSFLISQLKDNSKEENIQSDVNSEKLNNDKAIYEYSKRLNSYEEKVRRYDRG